MENVVEKYKLLMDKKRKLEEKRISVEAILTQKKEELDVLCKKLFVRYGVSSVVGLLSLKDDVMAKIDASLELAKKHFPEL